MQYISQTTFLSNSVLCLEHALGLLLVGLHAMSLALVEVLPLPVDEHLLVLALALRPTHDIPAQQQFIFSKITDIKLPITVTTYISKNILFCNGSTFLPEHLHKFPRFSGMGEGGGGHLWQGLVRARARSQMKTVRLRNSANNYFDY